MDMVGQHNKAVAVYQRQRQHFGKVCANSTLLRLSSRVSQHQVRWVNARGKTLPTSTTSSTPRSVESTTYCSRQTGRRITRVGASCGTLAAHVRLGACGGDGEAGQGLPMRAACSGATVRIAHVDTGASNSKCVHASDALDQSHLAGILMLPRTLCFSWAPRCGLCACSLLCMRLMWQCSS